LDLSFDESLRGKLSPTPTLVKVPTPKLPCPKFKTRLMIREEFLLVMLGGDLGGEGGGVMNPLIQILLRVERLGTIKGKGFLCLRNIATPLLMSP
jgi:hypothetical protein